MPSIERRVRMRMSGRLAAFGLAACLLAPISARAQGDESAGGALWVANATFDALFIRPAALATLMVGSALFVPAVALVAPSGPDLIEEAWEFFVLLPGQNLWKRPLGEF